MDAILMMSGLCTIVMNMSRFASMKHSLRSELISVWFRSISMMSHECSTLTFVALPDTTSKMRITLLLLVSRIATTSEEREIDRLFRNSARSPWYLGEDRILPS